MSHALVFDSGVGGLSVVEHLRAALPGARLSYVADAAFRPYGDKTEAQLQARLPGLLRTLEIMLAPDIFVLACNTASTTALTQIRAAVSAPVVGVVPAIKPAAAGSASKTIGVLGTPATVRQRYVGRLIDEHAGTCTVILHGSTRLVEMAEQKLAGGAVDMTALKAEITPLFRHERLDTIVLACTHFPLLAEELRDAAPRKVDWIDSGEAIARHTKTMLERLGSMPSPSFRDTAFIIGAAKEARPAFTDTAFAQLVSLPDL